jgi:hypothetical protein
MRIVLRLVTARGGAEIDVGAAIRDFCLVGRHGVFLETRLAFAGCAMKSPLVPGADNVVAFEGSLAERATDMIAGAGDGRQCAIDPSDREPCASDDNFLQRLLLENGDVAEVMSFGICHADSLTSI